MKKIIIAMAAIAAAFTMASCNKEQLVEPEKDITPTEGNCIITASTESSLTKTSLMGNDTDGYEVVWSEGDTFKLRGETFTLIKGAGTTSGTFQGNAPAMNGTHTAFYPASYDGTNWPAEQSYTEGNGITGSPMTADVYCMRGEISGGKVEFKNVGGILRLTIKGSEKIKSIMVCTDNTPNITLNCGDGVDLTSTDGTVFHIAMPIGTHSGTSILFTTSNNKYCIKKLKSDLVINRSEITPASIKIDKWSNNSQAPEGALSGSFTVSAEGKRVYFSKGNLYWDGSIYGFESNQYDIEVTGHQSSFYWSNKAEYARGSDWNLDFNAPIAFFTNVDEVTANPGFTANGQTGLWRTLSKDEWHYLINRDNGIGEATIGGVKGVIIFHDEYDGQTDGLTSIPEGCVFLPASDRGAGVMGFYWSSTQNLESSSYIPSASGLRYGDGAWPPFVVLDGMAVKNSVRLVTDVPDSPTPTYTVTFDANGHGTAPADISVPYHGTITKPTDPTADGYTLWGWYKDAACTAEWDFAKDVVTSNTTLYANWKISGALAGTFTVNDYGKKVYFSKGNLWRDSNGLFHFEGNQYDFNSGDYDTEHISHFMWSKDADVSCALQYDDPSRDTNDVFFTNADETKPNPDFTVNGQEGMWRTLSTNEWSYLINHNGSLWTTISGVKGLIIFCDGYSGSTTGLTEIPKGCFFLPAAGDRLGNDGTTYIINAGSFGFYWSASSFGGSTAFDLRFNSGGVAPNDCGARNRAQSVRLVTDITE